ncbi:MAG: hypothetical protein RL124_626 [Acidobacteriota bacterium]|jgi:hypothetical protein
MGRVFNLEEAQKLTLEVRNLTAPVTHLAESMAQELQTAETQGHLALEEDLKERLKTLVESWTEGVQHLGGEVKGLWLVDFDAGHGYWCWSWPESELSFWHTHEGGFRSRKPLKEKKDLISTDQDPLA